MGNEQGVHTKSARSRRLEQSPPHQLAHRRLRVIDSPHRLHGFEGEGGGFGSEYAEVGESFLDLCRQTLSALG